MNRALFRKEALAQQSDGVWGPVLITQPLSLRVLTSLLAFAALLALLFLAWGNYTRKEKVPGILAPAAGIVAVYSVQPGLLAELFVTEGERVEANAPLFRVQVDQKSSAGSYLSGAILSELGEQRARLVDGLQLEARNLAARLAREDRLIARLDGEMASLARLIETQARIHQLQVGAQERAQTLHAGGALSRADMDNVERQALEQQQELARLQLTLVGKRFEKEAAQLAREGHHIDSARGVSDLKNRISELDRQIAHARAEQFYIVRAPAAGTVSALLASPGQRVDPTLPVFSLLPQDSPLEAHLYVPTRAIGFIAEGQDVKLRYDAFPYQRFGLYPGKVSRISRTALSGGEVPLPAANEPVYKLVVTLQSQHVQAYGRQVRLRPGILLWADIDLERRNLLQWLLDPLYSLKGRL